MRGGTAVVTGAASGIGAALAVRRLAARGANVALADRDAAGLAAVAAAARAGGSRVSEHVVDLADRDAIAALPADILDRHGQISMLVNNAGGALAGQFTADVISSMLIEDVSTKG